jgi:hypothetical protein
MPVIILRVFRFVRLLFSGHGTVAVENVALRLSGAPRLFVVMSVSIGVFALGTVQTLRSGAPERWFLSLAGAASIGFAFSFLAVGFDWVRLGPPHFFWIWMSSYFGFCAIFMLWLALRVHSHFSSVPRLSILAFNIPVSMRTR